jgi:hypothetical protein
MADCGTAGGIFLVEYREMQMHRFVRNFIESNHCSRRKASREETGPKADDGWRGKRVKYCSENLSDPPQVGTSGIDEIMPNSVPCYS